MINREEVNKCLDVIEKLDGEDVELTVRPSGRLDLKIYPKNWWSSAIQWSADRRHEVLSIVTPLVGKLEKQEDGGDIGYKGEKDNIFVRMNYVDRCKIVGYKTVTKTVQKEVEREPEYETVEETERIAITDCDIKQGKFSEEDIEVTA